MAWLDFRPDPPLVAHTAEPLTPEEIDALPEAARIWATIATIREEHEALIEEKVDSAPMFCHCCQEAIG